MPKLIDFKELRDHGVLLKRRQIDNLERENKFPKRVPLTEWRVAWVAAEIEAWVEAKIKARKTDLGKLGAGREKRRGKAREA